MLRVFTVISAAALVVLSPASQAQEPPPQDPQRPTFRSGAHYVSVDAYPARDGKPITGLTAADFELLEDGKPQTIERLEYIAHPEWTPLADRRDPNSQRDGFNLARDPKYRVFVLYLDAYHVDFGGSNRMRVPIAELLNRMMGPQDLFGMITPAQGVKGLMLGQLTQTIEEQLTKNPDWGLAGREASHPEPGERELEAAYPQEAKRLIALRRLDHVYADLEELIVTLGALREERKNIVFFSDAMPSPRVWRGDMTNSRDRSQGLPPPIGTSPEGQLTIGNRRAGEPDGVRMSAERLRLLSIDFDQRFRDMLRDARRANVAFYTVRPGGLDPGVSMLDPMYSNLQVLAEQTDGVAVVSTNDLRAGMAKIADDLSSHYVLGYYTNNTRWDGGTRKITVRLKSTGRTIRARREYRAPTDAEMAAIRTAPAASAPAAATPVQTALGALSRVSPAARLNAYGTVIGSDVAIVAEIGAAEMEGGRWKQGADIEILLSTKDAATTPVTLKGRIEPGSRGTVVRAPVGNQTGPWQAVVRMRADDGTDSDTVAIERGSGALLGNPLAFRAASAAASAYRPLAAFHFRRTERVRVDWPVLQPLDSHAARLLDRTGKPLAIPLTTATLESQGANVVSTIVNLAPLSNGDYLIEMTAKAGDKTEQQTVAVRVTNSR